MVANIKFYILNFLIGTLIFFLILWSDIFSSDTLYFSFFKSLLTSAFVVSILSLFYILKYKKKLRNNINYKDLLILLISFIFLHYFIYINIVFNTSRSVSVMIMGHFLKNSESLITEKEISQIINNKYFIEEKAIKRRLSEQVNLGHLKLLNGNYKITKKGSNIIKLFGFVTKIYNVKKNYALEK